MVLIKKNHDKIFITKNDNVILYNLTDETDQYLTIPQPEVPKNINKEQKDVLIKETRKITSIDFDRSGEYTAISTENKQLIIYDKDFNVKKNFIVNRTASKVCFTASNDIIVADKTGDVYLYKKETENKPILLLGHLSVILDVVLSECGKYIITCDRDEKIRVSCFPNSYNIVSFCLGHREFIVTIKLVKNVLVSASGDGTVRFWNYFKGEQLGIINTNDYIKDNNLLEMFAKQMDKEKVDITALPVNDMQIYEESKKLYIAVSIYIYDGIQLYTMDLLTFTYNYITNLEVNNPFCFTLSNELYILSNTFYKFKLVEGNFIPAVSNLEKFYEKYKHILTLKEDNSLTVLYKRKYDNVKEYLERKKQRLELK